MDAVLFGGEAGSDSFERGALGAGSCAGAAERRFGDEVGVKDHGSARGSNVAFDGGVGNVQELELEGASE